MSDHEKTSQELRVKIDEALRTIDSLKETILRQKDIENELRKSEERYRITLQSMSDAVSIIRLEDLRYVYCNDAFSRITGYSIGEIIGKTPLDPNLTVVPEEMDQCIRYGKNSSSIDNLQHQCRKKDRTIMDTLISARPVFYEGEKCMVMVMKDITALKLMEEEKTRLEIRSQKMESIETLAGGIAHDFNNLLTTIIGYTRMSMKGIANNSRNNNKELNEVLIDLDEVRNAAMRARDLVNSIISFSRHPGKDFVQIDLGSTIRESLKAVRQSLPANISIEENLLSRHLIRGDPAQIHQVMANLCSNAAHAMEEKGGLIEVGITKVEVAQDASMLDPDIPSGPYVRLRVKDTGPGMTNTVMMRIFDPYFTTRFNGKGTGLGLSIVHGIVKSHGGAITCTSAIGEGTTFDIYLPDASVPDAAVLTLDGKPLDMAARKILDLDGGQSRDGSLLRPGDNPERVTDHGDKRT